MNITISVTIATDDGKQISVSMNQDAFNSMFLVVQHNIRDRAIAQQKYEQSGLSYLDYPGYVPEPSVTYNIRQAFAALQKVERIRTAWYEEANRG